MDISMTLGDCFIRKNLRSGNLEMDFLWFNCHRCIIKRKVPFEDQFQIHQLPCFSLSLKFDNMVSRGSALHSLLVFQKSLKAIFSCYFPFIFRSCCTAVLAVFFLRNRKSPRKGLTRAFSEHQRSVKNDGLLP